MFILGLSGHYHDAAAALLKDGRLVSAIEEEKLVRVKNIGLIQCAGLPYESIRYCLNAAGIEIKDIDYVTYYLKPRHLLKRQLRFGDSLSGLAFDSSKHRAASLNEYNDRMNTVHLIGRLLDENSKVITVDHQLAHAAGAFYTSGFERAAIIILSGKGDHISLSIGLGDGRKIRLVKRVEFPHSLGWLYSLVTEYLGYRAHGGEYSTQWLSVDGEPEYLDSFQDMIKIDDSGMPAIDLSYINHSFQGPDAFSEKFYWKFGDTLRRKDHRFNNGTRSESWSEVIDELTGRPRTSIPADSYRRNIAHSLQQRLEQVVLSLVKNVRLEYQTDSLCLAGSLAANALLISRLERDSGYHHIFVPPATGSAGCSIGGPLYLYHHQFDQGSPESLQHAFLGPEYRDQEIKPVLDNCKLNYRYLASENTLLEEVAKMLEEGRIVAWFQGRAEFGSRSLGSRSILASPLHEYTKDNLNLFVKHRESYRPFAASVPEERAGEFFEGYSCLSRFLLTVSRVREDKKHLIPAAWFSNGLARVHVVDRATNPLFWKLLNKFGEKTGIPVIVNTSFNLFGEPIVCTPRDAVRSFYCSGIDALIINRFLVKK